MNRDVLALLRDADPADALVPESDVRAEVERLMAAAPDTGCDTLAGRSRLARRPVAVGAGLVAVAAAVLAMTGVSWPWSHGTTTTTAYGVTPQHDGSVVVLEKWTKIQDPAQLQAQLRAVGIPAVVFRESTDCSQPLQDGILLDPKAITWPNPEQHPDETLVVRPGLLPPDSAVVIGLPVPGQPSAASLYLYVTQSPPACMPQTTFAVTGTEDPRSPVASAPAASASR